MEFNTEVIFARPGASGLAAYQAGNRSGTKGKSAAQIGLETALMRGRSQAADVDAGPSLASLPPAVIVAQLSTNQRAELAAKLSATAAKDRVKIVAAAVANDENCKGKAELALSMLADDDYAGLNGSALVKIIASAPACKQSSAKADEAARADMRAAIAEATGYSFEPSAAPATGSQSAARLWGKAIANLPPAAA